MAAAGGRRWSPSWIVAVADQADDDVAAATGHQLPPAVTRRVEPALVARVGVRPFEPRRRREPVNEPFSCTVHIEQHLRDRRRLPAQRAGGRWHAPQRLASFDIVFTGSSGPEPPGTSRSKTPSGAAVSTAGVKGG